MSFIDWSQILIFVIIIFLISPIVGKYMAIVLEGKPSFLTPLLGWLENSLSCLRYQPFRRDVLEDLFENSFNV